MKIISVPVQKAGDDKSRRTISQLIAGLAPARLLLTLGVSIFVAEVAVMIILPLLPQLPTWLEALLDGSMMMILISLPLYFLVFRPLINAIIERQRAEEGLRRSRDEMELRVKERTADLLRANEELTEEIGMRRSAEKALGETHRKLDATLVNMADGFVAYDRDWRYTYVNPAALQLLGKTRDELLGKVCWDVFPETVGTSIDTIFHRAVEQGDSVQFEQFRESGNAWYEARCHPTEDGLVVFFNDITVRKEAEKQIEHLASFPRLNPNPVLEVDTSGAVRFVNAAASRVLQELNTDPDPHMLLPCDMDTLLAGLGESAETVNREVEVQGRTFLETIVLSREFSGARVYATEITRRKRAEVELRESREDLNRAQTVARTGSWRLDVRRDELLWSDETYRIFGIPKGTPLTYETFLGSIHPDDREYLDQQWKAALRGEPYDIEHRIVVDGCLKWVRERAELEINGDGSVRGGFGTVQDITELKHAEEALHRSLEEYRSLMEEASDGILLFEGDTVIAANSRLCTMLGFGRDEFSSRNVHDLLPLESAGKFPPSLQRGDTSADVIVEHQLRRKDGTLIDVETTAKRLADGRFQAIMRDVTAKKLQEQRLRSLMKEEVFEKLLLRVRAFKHGQSGAMNLNRLALFAENLQVIRRTDGAAPGDVRPGATESAATGSQVLLGRFETAVEEFGTIVSPELHRIASLVMLAEVDPGHTDSSEHFRVAADALLALNEHLKERIGFVTTLVRSYAPDTFEQLTPALQDDILGTIMKIRYAIADVAEYVETNFTTVVADAVNTCVSKFALRSAGVQMTFVDRAERGRVVFNTSELCDVVSILIENSLDAFGKQGAPGPGHEQRLVLLTERVGDIIRIVVEDNGPGVTSALRDRIFEEEISDKSPGRGFGLSYAKKCVAKFGGRIYHAPSFKEGARFVIEMVSHNAPAQRTPSDIPWKNSLSSMTAFRS